MNTLQPNSPQTIDTNECADETGIMGCIVGKSGIGKTSQLLTLPEATTLFCDFEAGDLSVRRKWRGVTRKPRTWQECRDIAAMLGGANPDRRPDQTYSQAHYTDVCRHIDKSLFDKCDTVFMDSISAIVKMCFQWCVSQSSDRSGKCDTRASYGLLAQEMNSWLLQLRLRCNKHIWFTGLLDERTDEYGRKTYCIHMDGNKVTLDFIGMLDVMVTMADVRDAQNKPLRVFVCGSANEWGYPAKDRSEQLSSTELPDLGKLMQKILMQKVTPASDTADGEVQLGQAQLGFATGGDSTTTTNTTNINQSTINKVSI